MINPEARQCLNCHVDITFEHHRAKRCKPCREDEKLRARDEWKRRQAERAEQADSNLPRKMDSAYLPGDSPIFSDAPEKKGNTSDMIHNLHLRMMGL